jgi:hypothetical protein
MLQSALIGCNTRQHYNRQETEREDRGSITPPYSQKHPEHHSSHPIRVKRISCERNSADLCVNQMTEIPKI